MRNFFRRIWLSLFSKANTPLHPLQNAEVFCTTEGGINSKLEGKVLGETGTFVVFEKLDEPTAQILIPHHNITFIRLFKKGLPVKQCDDSWKLFR